MGTPPPNGQNEDKLSGIMGSTSSVKCYYCFLGPTMETQKQPAKKRKLFSSFYETLIAMEHESNHKNPEEESEGTSEVSTEFTLVESNNKKPKTSDNGITRVSTTLKLFDDTWPTESKVPFVAKAKKKGEPAYKIAMMKHYRPGEEQEERIKGVSTKLNLFTDPWKIKKRLTHSDLGHLCRLLVQTSMVDRYVLPFLRDDTNNEVKSKEGWRVMVWDQDTQSEHSLIMKKWSTSKSYVFIDGWSQKFVNRRDLQAGDEIGLYWDSYYERFNFRIMQRAVDRNM